MSFRAPPGHSTARVNISPKSLAHVDKPGQVAMECKGADRNSVGGRTRLAKLSIRATELLQQEPTRHHTGYDNGGPRQTTLAERWRGSVMSGRYFPPQNTHGRRD
jgi:hypothetical protein